MAGKSVARRLGCDALVAACIGLIPAEAGAQDASIGRIEAIERQIRDLQGELKQLKGELGAAKQQLQQSRNEAQRSKEEARQARAAADQARQDAAKAATVQSQAAQAASQVQAAAAATAASSGGDSVKVAMPNGRPTVSSADGRMSFAIGAQVQFDAGAYFQNPGPFAQFPNLNSGVNLRRGRIFFVGQFDDWRLNITPDFGGSPDGSPSLYEANINYSGFKPVTATIGYFKPWFSLYDSQSSNFFLLMERPSIVEIARNVAAGDARASVGAKASTSDYFISSYLTGAQYGAQSSGLLNGEQIGYVGRLAGRPYYDNDWNVHLGVSGEYVFRPNSNASGAAGVDRTTLNFQDRPELRIDMNRLISTGAISTDNASVYGGAAALGWRNLLLQGEYYKISNSQSRLPNVPAPNLGFHGWYVEGGWIITGEKFRYSTGDAAFAKPRVADPWIVDQNGFSPGAGMWQLGLRYSVTDLNSEVTAGTSQSVTGGVFGGLQRIFGAALSWYPNDWVRLELQYQLTDVARLNAAGISQIGQRFSTLAGRAQVAF